MLLQDDKVLHDRKTLLFFIGILTLMLLFTPYLEIKSKPRPIAVADTFFQDTAWDDLNVYDYISRTQKSKDNHQQQAMNVVSVSTILIASFVKNYSLRHLPTWAKPTYYEFLFRYTLF